MKSKKHPSHDYPRFPEGTLALARSPVYLPKPRPTNVRYLREATIVYRRSQQQLPARTIRTSKDAAKTLRPLLLDGPQEQLVVLGLNSAGLTIGWHLVSIGSVNQCSIVPADVFRWAVLSGAPQIILGHNHPSGDCTPSEHDLQTTRELVQAGELLGIKLLDHLILAEGDAYTSVRDVLLALQRGHEPKTTGG